MNRELESRVFETLQSQGLYYNLGEVIGHLTAFNHTNEMLNTLLNMNDGEFIECIENACNIIDLNEEEIK